MAVLDGEARVLLTAQHIVKALGTTDAMTDDMIQVLSKFDHRFSGMTEKKKIMMDDKKSPEPSTSQKVEDSVPPHQQQQTAPRGARGGRHAKANNFALDAAESVIEQWGMSGDEESRWIFDGPQEESSSCMEAVDEVLKQLESMKIHNRDPETLERAQNLLQLAMEKLVEEFRHLLESCSGSVDPDLLLDSFSAGSFNQALNEIGNLEGSSSNPDAETTSGDDDAENDDDDDDDDDGDVSKSRPLGEPQLTVALVPAEVAQGLSDIATRLIAGGYKRECVQVYVSSRKGVLEESLSSLGAERLSIDEVQKMGWPLQEEKIKKWNQAIKVGVRVLFASEKQLCDQIFSASSSDTCFNDIAKGPAMQLLNFGEAIAISRRSPEKLFKILDMYDTLQGLLPELDAVFSGISGASVRSEAKELLKRLGEASRGNFAEFENAIQRDGSKIPVPGGAVHPLTRYVMNYIKLLCDYAPTLKLVFGDKELCARDGVPHSSDDRREPREELSPLAGELNRLTQALQTNLEGKAKIYQDPALTHLFLMNNVHYIVQKVKTSEVRSLVGDIWVRRQTSLVRQYATGYQRATWSKVLSYLRGEGIQTAGTANGVSRVVLKERFKNFNSVFDEVHKAQSQWVVIDPQLRDELQIFIADKLLPAYRAFVGRYGHYIENGRHPDKYIKYTVEDLEIAIGDFFTGNSGSMSSSRRRSFSLHST